MWILYTILAWFLLSLIVSPIIGKCIAYGLGEGTRG